MLEKDDIMHLIEIARDAQKQAYAPYSGFHVGAALLCENGDVYLGCNVENCSYGLTNCAERTAIFKAVSEGETKFTALACVFSTDDFAVPCGACRQVISEFGQDIFIIMANGKGEYQTAYISELLPAGFSGEHLKK